MGSKFCLKFQRCLLKFHINFEPIHRKICILRGVKILMTYDILKLWHLKSLWNGPQLSQNIWGPLCQKQVTRTGTSKNIPHYSHECIQCSQLCRYLPTTRSDLRIRIYKKTLWIYFVFSIFFKTCHQQFTIMLTHCASTIDNILLKMLQEMCHSTHIYSEVWRQDCYWTP